MITLFIWTVVAAERYVTYTDWRALAQFETVALCEQAVQSMNLVNRHRCLKTK
jgi:hypothetical protein